MLEMVKGNFWDVNLIGTEALILALEKWARENADKK
jgi:hypothetical protein